MTYCVAMRLDAGLVFLSDSRTNAGVDHIGTFRKLTVHERTGERLMVLMTAGNLSISQQVRSLLQEPVEAGAPTLWNVSNMFEAARLVGQTVREVYRRDADALKAMGVDFNVSLLFGGQIGSEAPRLFQIYAAGNFIEAHSEQCYFQIGESKYGKPILDRVITPATPLDEAAKCALISMDSTLRSNISVGLPLDLLIYERDSLKVTHFAAIDERNQYFQMIRSSWGQRLRQVFSEIPDPVWASPDAGSSLQSVGAAREPLRVLAPGEPHTTYGVQLLAQEPGSVKSGPQH